MRVEHSPIFEYIVFYGCFREAQLSQHCVQLKCTHTPRFDARYIDQIRRGALNVPSVEFSNSFQPLLVSFLVLFRRLDENVLLDLVTFQQTAANTRHGYLLLMYEIEKLDRAGVLARVEIATQHLLRFFLHDIIGQAHATAPDHYFSMVPGESRRADVTGIWSWVLGNSKSRLQGHLRRCKRQISVWDQHNFCANMASMVDNSWDYARSCFFIVLPSDLSSWDDSNPSTHRFRLHFLCGMMMKDVTASNIIPHHVHLSNHPGYDLKRPLEFFLVYGDYVLRVLRMVKRGSFLDFLWGMNTSDHVSKGNIDLLVSKAIVYLKKLSYHARFTNLWPSRCQAASIKMYLDVPACDDVQGNLHRHINGDQKVYWMCQAHIPQSIGKRPLQQLVNFVRTHDGYVDLQKATLKVELESQTEADQFRTLLAGAKRTFDIIIKLKWKATRPYVKELCHTIAETKAVVLKIDGITRDIHPQNHVQYTTNLIADGVTRCTDLRLVRLFNYPRPLEQCLYFGKFELHLKLTPTGSLHDWVALKAELDEFGEVVCETHDPSDCKVAAKKILSALACQGLSDVIKITIYNGDWDGVFDLQRGVFVEVHSSGTNCPEASVSTGSLQRLTQDIYDEEDELELYRMVLINTGLEDLRISTEGRNILHQVERISRLRCDSRCPLRLTLLERMQDTRARVVAQVVTGGVFSECLLWDCDHIFSPLSDYDAEFLDMATLKYPSVLTLLTLDVSQLSWTGFVSVEKVLQRTSLEHLRVICNLIPSHLSRSASRVLGSIRWPTLKSLALTGDDIDGWIRLWPSTMSPRLVRLHIQVTGPQQELSHSGVLFIHRLIFMSPLVELNVENVHLKDKLDWALIIESMDLGLLKYLDMCQRSRSQFISNPGAVNLLSSFLRVDRSHQDAPIKINIGVLQKSQGVVAKVVSQGVVAQGVVAPRPSKLKESWRWVLHR